MGNFFRRAIAFISGMLFMLIVLVGGIVGGAYWAYKNLTLGDVVQGTDMGDVASWTIEECIAYANDISKDPDGFTLKELEKQGFNFDDLFTSMGINVETADPKDLESLKNVTLTSLFSDGGVNELSMGILFLYIPKNEETGKYPIFSEGARKRLRQYSLGDMISADENGNLGLLSVMRSMKIGSVLSEAFDETLNLDGSYTYSATDKGLDLIANVEMGLLTDNVESGATLDLGKEFSSGYLKNLGSMSLREIVASFGATDQESFDENYNNLAILDGPIVNELFSLNPETSVYDFDFDKLLNYVNFQNILGYTVCSEDVNCKVHSNVSECDGDIYTNDGVSAEFKGLQFDLMHNVLALGISDFLEGFDFTMLVKNMYLGGAFGYVKANAPVGSDFCDINCQIQDEGHSHKFYFVDDKGEYVGSLLNQVANVSFEGALNGELDFEGILSGVKIGEILMLTYENGLWKDADGNYIDKDDLNGKIMYQLYDKTLETIGSISIDELISDVYLGEFIGLTYNELTNRWEDSKGVEADLLYGSIAGIKISELLDSPDALTNALGELYIGEFMGFEKCSNNANCLVHGEGCTLADGAWYKLENNVYVALSGIDKVLAELSFNDVLNGNFDVEDSLSTLKIGEVLGYTYDETYGWKDSNGLVIVAESLTDKVFVKLYDKTLTDFKDGGIEISTLLEDVKLGEFLGLTYTENGWKDGDNEPSLLYKKLADASVSKLLNGEEDLEALISNAYIGEFMGYVKTGENWYDNGVLVEGSNAVIANILLGDVFSGNVNIIDSVNGTQIGEILGYTYDSVDARWEDDKGAPVIAKTMTERVFVQLYDKTLTDLKDGNVKMETLLSGIKLGEFLGLTYTENGWKDGEDEPSLLYKKIADVSVSKLLTGEESLTDALSGVYVGEFLGYTKNVTDWYDNGEKVTGVYGIVANITLGDVFSGNVSLNLDSILLSDLISPNGNKILQFLCDGETTVSTIGSKINTMTIGDVVDVSNSKMLGLLADYTLEELPTAIDSLYVGEIMGYTQSGIKWYNNGEEVTGINAKIADLTVKSLGNGGFDSIDFVVGDVISDTSSGVFSLMDLSKADGTSYASVSEVPVSEIARRTTTGASKATYRQLNHAGIISFDKEAELDGIFAQEKLQGVDWRDWSVNDILNNLIAKVTTMGGR